MACFRARARAKEALEKHHATDKATMLSWRMQQVANQAAEYAVAEAMKQEKVVHPAGLPSLRLDPASDILFDYGPALPGHANGMVFMATDAQGDVILQQSYYSIGGGFVVTEEEMASGTTTGDIAPYPYEFNSANESCHDEG